MSLIIIRNVGGEDDEDEDGDDENEATPDLERQLGLAMGLAGSAAGLGRPLSSPRPPNPFTTSQANPSRWVMVMFRWRSVVKPGVVIRSSQRAPLNRRKHTSGFTSRAVKTDQPGEEGRWLN